MAVAMSLLAALASGKDVAEEAEAADETIVPRITADAIGLIGWMDGWMDGWTEVRFGCVLFREGSSSGALIMMRVCSQSIFSTCMQALSPLIQQGQRNIECGGNKHFVTHIATMMSIMSSG